jgi:hypothetical protein
MTLLWPIAAHNKNLAAGVEGRFAPVESVFHLGWAAPATVTNSDSTITQRIALSLELKPCFIGTSFYWFSGPLTMARRLSTVLWCNPLLAIVPGGYPIPGPASSGRCQLTYNLPIDMVSHMKTTLNIDDTVMAQLKREAASQGRTMSELVETALRVLFRSPKKSGNLPPLPTFHSGGTLVEVADRDALYHAMEGR